ncbi:MAG: hypothetical protein EOS40_08215 [Mesorhizobium sp.]|nr:MAG: hypothetical protein EOS40_08215 [Mesorhizobium sp.]
MALFGLLLSFIPYSLLLATWNVTWKQLAAAIALPLISLAILLFGMQSVYSRLRGNFKYTDATQTTVRSHLLLSLQKGTTAARPPHARAASAANALVPMRLAFNRSKSKESAAIWARSSRRFGSASPISWHGRVHTAEAPLGSNRNRSAC